MNERLLNREQLAEIRALARVRPEFPEQMLLLFKESATEALEGCRDAWLEQDARRLESFAHRLKGTAASFGASELREQAERLEMDADCEASIERQRLEDIEQTIEATYRAYADWLQQA